MKYTPIIETMTWSFSRITKYLNCPYGFFLSYICEDEEKKQFFSDYGTYMHNILQQYLSGKMKKEALVGYYYSHFKENISERAPSPKIFENYLRQGAEYLRNISFPVNQVKEVEKKVSFELDGKQFVGFVDAVVDTENGYSIVDHKSRQLKPRSQKGKVLKTDRELDEYLRQLYLYSIPLIQEYGKVPEYLVFNCFREQVLIEEPFSLEALEKTKQWALSTIKMIESESDWNPKLDYFRCQYLCDHCDQCEYFKLYRGDTK